MNYGNFTVVLPTLNEAKTVGTLIRRLAKSYPGIRIIVVDDGSTDMTKSIVSAASGGNGNVRFLDRSKSGVEKGLTASVADGIIKSTTRFAIVMDADMQHPTGTIKEMALELVRGRDLVVATRASVKGWALHRKIISKTLILVGYAALAVKGGERPRDIFSGFFGIDRRLFARVYNGNRNRFVGGGYKVLFDFLKSVRHNSINICEVPYQFGLRSHGTSKAGFRQGILLFESFFT
ncbi:MAG: glycosyltransferase [Candidatus Marsarchaeota archaeon]|nr:glycosyltransferase [Candidatus Marsarchaeota archaeon]MCL5412885.1 glycosyltransferase [Candidatus Marsarchaeota archaeon]